MDVEAQSTCNSCTIGGTYLLGSTSMRGNERATIKAHPATPHLPRPYGNGIPPEWDSPGGIENHLLL